MFLSHKKFVRNSNYESYDGVNKSCRNVRDMHNYVAIDVYCI